MTTYLPFWSRFWRRVQVVDESNDDSCWEWCQEHGGLTQDLCEA